MSASVPSNRLAQVAVPAAIIAIVVMMVVPLPSVLLDLLLVVNLSAAVVILLTAMSVERPLDFSIFPSLLLVATMMRLSLNVSATRLVLLDGFAGKVIESFGHFVVGGSLVVGLVIFLILVVIQFVVITSGASRVAEVAARFTLDAMPGKQMSIDADLSAGLISEDQARQRRREVAAEADFYGAMDGASKFVKGDAIAGIIITAINLVGGFIVGVAQRGLSLGEAVEAYSLLTIGDGLVSQIPALLISIASGLIVTRAATESDLGTDVLAQFGSQERAVRIAAVSVAVLAVIPGLPKLPFLLVAAALWMAAARAKRRKETTPALPAADPVVERVQRDAPEAIAADMRIDPLELEIGYGLLDLIDAGRGGDLLDRVRALRRKVAMDLGLVIPPVRTRDNVDLPAAGYAIRVHGVVVARGESPPGTVLVLGECPPGMPGQATVDPVFGMAATWVPADLAAQAEAAGATVVDRGSVITAHLAEVVRRAAARLLSRQDVKLLVDGVRETDPVVAEELGAAGLTLAEVQVVLQNLLDEQVPIRDLVRILEVLSERARLTRDPVALTEAVRAALGPAIVAGHVSDGQLVALTLDPLLEHGLLEAVRPTERGPVLATEPAIAERLVGAVRTAVHDVEQTGAQPVLLCSAGLRAALRRLLLDGDVAAAVVAYSELDRTVAVDVRAAIDLTPQLDAPTSRST